MDPRLYNTYAGRYELSNGIRMAIKREGDRLFLEAPGAPTGSAELELFPESETKFFLKSMNVQVTFTRGNRGRVDRLSVRQDDREMPARRVE